MDTHSFRNQSSIIKQVHRLWFMSALFERQGILYWALIQAEEVQIATTAIT